jgi:arylsulfatase A-like enzyme
MAAFQFFTTLSLALHVIRAAAFFVLWLSVAWTALAADRPANVLVILADDLGYGDLHSFGSQAVQTPHLDRLAASGVRLTSFYADAPVCSPTRASLLTGQAPQRHGVTGVIATGDAKTGMRPNQLTMATVFQGRGYRTALFGKWHLGSKGIHLPNRRGFDEFFGGLMGGLDFFRHDTDGAGHDLWNNGDSEHHDRRYITDLVADRAVKFISANRDHPFFMLLSFHAVHTAMGSRERGVIQAPQRWLDHYQQSGLFTADQTKSLQMAACISAMDEGVGRVLDILSKSGLEEQTVIWFTSDNGPLGQMGGSAGPFRGAKHSLWEGGIRVPAIVRFPGKLSAGAVVDMPAATRDILPTLCEAAGLEISKRDRIDGESLWPQLCGKANPSQRTLCWSYVRESHATREQAVRRGRWKWLNGELYDLESDPGETKNLAEAKPEIASQLAEAWQTWIREFPQEAQRWQGRPAQRRDSKHSSAEQP